jgi:hypothetical protein
VTKAEIYEARLFGAPAGIAPRMVIKKINLAFLVVLCDNGQKF